MFKADNTKSIIILALALLGHCAVSAQLLGEGDILLQPTELLNTSSPLKAGSEAYIQQIGAENELELFQDQNGALGNLARVLQDGNWNVALITQTDSGNRLALIQQGNENLYELLNSGLGNEAVVIQQGDGNVILQQLLNSNGVKTELMQIGNSNEITSILENMEGGNFTVKQIGDGLKLIIRQSSF